VKKMNEAAAVKDPRTYTIHSLEEVEVDTRVRAIATLSQEDARALTTQIQRTSVRLWLLVTEAHDRKAHLALGYETWADYVRAELSMSESRSYQFLDTGHVMKALAAGGVDIQEMKPPPVRIVSRVKDRLTDVRKTAEQAVKKGESVDKAIRTLAREPKGGRGQPAAAASAPDVVTAIPSPRKSTEGRGQVACPACAGSGKVTRVVADRLLTLINKM